MAQRMSYPKAVAALESALKFGINPSLDGIHAMVTALADPQESTRFVQVTGTNGKTSVTRLTAAILAAHGAAVGGFTSPHLVDYTERIQLDGEPVGRADFARAIAEALEAAGSAGMQPTEFELLTAAALWLFASKGVDWAVLEVGMGGRWDATSVVVPRVAVITGVGLDHVQRLGSTVEEIAADKAQIIKRGGVAVLGPGTAAVDEILAARASEVRADVVRVRVEESGAAEGDVGYSVDERPRIPGGRTRMSVRGRRAAYLDLTVRAPSYQAANVAVAVAAAESALDRPLDVAVLRAALSDIAFPGRFEVLRDLPPLVVDGAHNPEAAGVLAGAIAEAWPDVKRPVGVLGVLADKDAGRIVSVLARELSGIVVTQPDSPRALPADMLAQHVLFDTGHLPPVEPDPAAAIERASEAAGDAGVVVAGSLYLVGEVKALMRSRKAAGR